MTPSLFDVHTHAEFAAFKDDYQEVIRRALNRGIWLNNVGSQKTTSEKSVMIARDYDDGVYATVGFHPIHVSGGEEDPQEELSAGEEFDYDFFKNLAMDSKVVAVGECGLDYFHLKNDAKEEQKEVFIKHIELSAEIGKPLMIHCRDAYPDLIEILRRERGRLSSDRPGISHFFTGSVADAESLLQMGFMFSFGGAITFSGSYDEVLRKIPLEKILLETDAPYVSPAPFRGKRNEPLYVSYVSDYIAKAKGVASEEVARQTTENALSIFAIKG
ncbi:MAG: TatD family hydrolase [Patescibacteria group bacterium]|nr:TatD family hydrolase [Patescibacteria group bacterium]MCL5262088.1 TatD family hydrolase [Patescibacteria group bacterium]